MKSRMALVELDGIFTALHHRAIRGELYELSFATEIAIV